MKTEPTNETSAQPEPQALVGSTALVAASVCPECAGTGKVGDYGPGGVLLHGKWSGNAEWETCDCIRTNG